MSARPGRAPFMLMLAARAEGADTAGEQGMTDMADIHEDTLFLYETSKAKMRLSARALELCPRLEPGNFKMTLL